MKILISSDCNGHLQFLSSKIAQLNQKNHFDCIIMCGSVLSTTSSAFINKLKNKQVQIAIPGFFIDSGPLSGVLNVLYPNGTQIGNLQFLGCYGVKQINGCKLAFLNGRQFPYHQQVNNSYLGPYYTNDIIERLTQQCNKFEHIDILMTSEWADGYPYNQFASYSVLISQLVKKVCPTYHISASGKKWYRMQPFKNEKNSVTHFINVAQIQNQKPSDKYLFALKLQGKPDTGQGKQLIPSPFDSIKRKIQDRIQKKETNQGSHLPQISTAQLRQLRKKKIQQSRDKQRLNQNQQIVQITSKLIFHGFPNGCHNNEIIEFLQKWGQLSQIQFFHPKDKFDKEKSGMVKFQDIDATKNCLKDTNKYSFFGNRIRFKLAKQAIGHEGQSDKCWFCPMNPGFEKQLVIYEGNACYISLDKGPICQSHLQIVPYSHQNDLLKLKDEQLLEIRMLKKKLAQDYAKQGKILVTYLTHLNLSNNIGHCVEYLLAVQGKQFQMISKFRQLNKNDRLNYKQYRYGNLYQTLRQILARKKQFYAALTIGDSLFVKELGDRQRRDYLRADVCGLIDLRQKAQWKQCILQTQQLGILINKHKQRFSKITSDILKQ